MRSLIADLDDAYCVELRRTRIGDFDVADADEERLIASTTRSPSCPSSSSSGDDARKAAHGVAVPRPRRGHRAACATTDGLIALAEPRGGATLKPVVGFRG